MTAHDYPSNMTGNQSDWSNTCSQVVIWRECWYDLGTTWMNTQLKD